MRFVVDFLRSDHGRVRTGGPVIYVVILGIFMSVVATMGQSDGARHLAGHNGPTIELDIRGWIENVVGSPLPQTGPLHR